MFHKLLGLLLAPWLIHQGKQVRANTIRLPEAAGERAGVSEKGEAPSVRLLCLGDSAAAGVGCELQSEAIMGQWRAQYAPLATVHWQLVAQSSLTCREVLSLLQDTRLSIAQPIDQVLISVGVNDVTRRTSHKQWREDLSKLTRYLQQALNAKAIIFTSLPPMHKFPALPQPLRWYLGAQARALDNELAKHCTRQKGVYHLQLNLPFAAKFMAKDGYHPSKEATPLWAKAAFELINNK